jgi:threonine dehydratase
VSSPSSTTRLSGRDGAHIFVGISTRSKQDAAALASTLNEAGYPTVNLTDNELAKLHVRHMVGGHSREVRDERVYRFEFPERPGSCDHTASGPSVPNRRLNV